MIILIIKLIALNHMSVFSNFIATNKLACNNAVGKSKMVKNISMQYIGILAYFSPNNIGINNSENDKIKVNTNNP